MSEGTPGGKNGKRFRPQLWITLITFAAVAIVSIGRSFPPLPRILDLRITLPAPVAGRTEPILTTGKFGAGDLLVVRYHEGNRVAFSYDTWGRGGPVTDMVPYEPGTEYRLLVEMPALSELAGRSLLTSGQVRVVFNGHELLHRELPFHQRAANEAYFGANPIRGSTDDTFRGQLTLPSGKRLFGGPGCIVSLERRLAAFFGNGTAVAGAVIIALLAGFGLPWLGARITRLAASAATPTRTSPPHRVAWIVGAISTAAFTVVITGGTMRVIYPEVFGSFYDYQALSLLQGRLDVPREALSGEAFIVGGKTYGYFGITPAILRIPFVALHVGFGLLSRSFMIVFFAGSLALSYALLRQAVRRLHGAGAEPSAAATGVFLTCCGLGSTLFFLSSRAYIYHEANLAGVMFTLWCVHYSIRHLDEPAGRAWIGALITGLLALHARPPSGMYALTLVGTVALTHLVLELARVIRRRPGNDATAATPSLRASVARHIGIGLLSVAAFLTFNLLSWMKFGSFDGAPLKYHVQYNAERLGRFEGRNFHLANVRHNADKYLLAPTLHFEPRFPWIYHGSLQRTYPGTKIDLAEATTAVPVAMAGLTTLLMLGGTWSLLVAPRTRLPLTVLTAAFLPMLLALLTAVATSHRYTADFCPYLIGGGAWALAAVDGALPFVRRAVLLVVLLLGLFSVAVTTALALQYQGAGVWGVPDDVIARHKQLRARIDAFFGVR